MFRNQNKLKNLQQKTCNVPSVTIVAHSMGGYSARLASINMLNMNSRDSSSSSKHLIRDIITLATPHQNPLYAWDSSIYDIHQRILQQEKDKQLVIVSLSGGLRDEMIDPYACNANHNGNSSPAAITVRVCLLRSDKDSESSFYNSWLFDASNSHIQERALSCYFELLHFL